MKVLLSIILTLFSVVARACPFCKTDAASKIRAALFGPGFLYNLGVSLLPFGVFYIVIILIYRIGEEIETRDKN